jgi:hypothetical protein
LEDGNDFENPFGTTVSDKSEETKGAILGADQDIMEVPLQGWGM